MTMFATRQELFAVGRRALASTPHLRLNPAVADIPGSDLNVVLGMFAVIAETVAARGARGMRGAFAELARGPQQDRLFYDRAGLLRFDAHQATVDLDLYRDPPGSATPGTYPAGSIVQTPSGLQFATTSDAVFGDYDTLKRVSAQAMLVGSDGNVPPTDSTAGVGISVFATAPFDPNLSVRNLQSAAGGTDAEDDIPYLGRYRAFFPTLSKGILGAIEYGAQQVPGIAVATASEIMNPDGGYPAASVQLVIGDQNGNATSAMVTQVATSLLSYRSAGIKVEVLTGTVVYQQVQWALAFRTGTVESIARERVRAVTVAAAQFLPPGPNKGKLYRSSLFAAARQVPGVILTEDSLRYPIGDVVPASAQEMIRVLPSQVTFV